MEFPCYQKSTHYNYLEIKYSFEYQYLQDSTNTHLIQWYLTLLLLLFPLLLLLFPLLLLLLLFLGCPP